MIYNGFEIFLFISKVYLYNLEIQNIQIHNNNV